MTTRSRRRNAAIVIGSAELASAIARTLHRHGFPTVMCDDVDPGCMRRGMAYTDAWYVGDARVEETSALFCGSARSVGTILAMREVIAATSWSWGGIARMLDACVVIDARTVIGGSPPNLIERASPHALTIGVASCYVAGIHAHRVLGARANAEHGSHTAAEYPEDALSSEPHRRTVIAPMAGRFATARQIGDYVMAGEALGALGRMLIYAPAAGVLSGLAARGARVFAGMPLVEVDTRGQAALCFTTPAWCRDLAEEALATVEQQALELA